MRIQMVAKRRPIRAFRLARPSIDVWLWFESNLREHAGGAVLPHGLHANNSRTKHDRRPAYPAASSSHAVSVHGQFTNDTAQHWRTAQNNRQVESNRRGISKTSRRQRRPNTNSRLFRGGHVPLRKSMPQTINRTPKRIPT